MGGVGRPGAQREVPRCKPRSGKPPGGGSPLGGVRPGGRRSLAGTGRGPGTRCRPSLLAGTPGPCEASLHPLFVFDYHRLGTRMVAGERRPALRCAASILTTRGWRGSGRRPPHATPPPCARAAGLLGLRSHLSFPLGTACPLAAAPWGGCAGRRRPTLCML